MCLSLLDMSFETHCCVIWVS